MEKRPINIPGYEAYKVDAEGNVYGKRGRVMSPYWRGSKKKKGQYLCLRLWHKDGYRKNLAVHRIVGFTWVDNPHGKKEVDHIWGDRSDVRAKALVWVTRSENEKRKRFIRGE